jgi:hypothetical protein
MEHYSDRRIQEKFMIKAFNRRKEGQTMEEQLTDAFTKIDADGNGSIDGNEMNEVLSELGWNLDVDQRQSLISRLDTNKDGVIQLSEFISFFSHSYEKKHRKKHRDNQETQADGRGRSSKGRSSRSRSKSPGRRRMERESVQKQAFDLLEKYFKQGGDAAAMVEVLNHELGRANKAMTPTNRPQPASTAIPTKRAALLTDSTGGGAAAAGGGCSVRGGVRAKKEPGKISAHVLERSDESGSRGRCSSSPHTKREPEQDEEDLNKASDIKLRIAKANMNVGFEENQISKTDAQYKYDVRADFGETTEDCGWDEDGDEDEEEGKAGEKEGKADEEQEQQRREAAERRQREQQEREEKQQEREKKRREEQRLMLERSQEREKEAAERKRKQEEWEAQRRQQQEEKERIWAEQRQEREEEKARIWKKQQQQQEEQQEEEEEEVRRRQKKEDEERIREEQEQAEAEEERRQQEEEERQREQQRGDADSGGDGGHDGSQWSAIDLDLLDVGSGYGDWTLDMRNKIGGGGFAVVFRGRYDGRNVAVKVLFDPNAGELLSIPSATFVTRFLSPLHRRASEEGVQ